MNKLTHGATRLLVLALGLGLVSTGWAVAPTATAVWESGQFEDAAEKHGGYSITLPTGASIVDGNIVLNGSETTGALINIDSSSTAVSVLIKYSGVTAPSKACSFVSTYVVNDANNSNFDINSISVGASLDLKGQYNNNSHDTKYAFSTVPTLSSSGYFLFTYDSNGGTGGYAGYSVAALKGGTNTELKFGSRKINKVALGGPSGQVTAYPTWDSGVTIEKVAIFVGSAYTASQMAEYYWPSAAARDYSRWSYADTTNVWTWAAPSTLTADDNIANNGVKYYIFDLHAGENTTSYTGGNTSSDPAYWPYFCYTEALNASARRYTAPGRVLRFEPSDTYRKVEINGKFGPLTLGGIIVEPGATGYSIKNPSGDTTARSMALGDPTGNTETWFDINEDFTINRTSNNGNALMGTLNFCVKSGKTWTFGKSAKLAQSWSPNTGGDGYPQNPVAGGVLKFHGGGKITIPTLTVTGATVDYSDLDTNPAEAFVNGTLAIDNNTKFIFPEGAVFPYKVATSISGTTTAYTDANGNVYTGVYTIDAENGTVSFDLSAATAIEVNGALTISSATSADITVNASGTLTLDTGAVLSGTVTGDGTVIISNTVNLSSAVSVTVANLYLTGSSLTIGDGVDLEVTTMLRTAQASSPSDCSITQTGGSLTCSGPANDGYKLGAFVLSHYPKITTYTLSGGTLTVSNSQAKFGADGTGNMTISGTGVANFHSLSLRRGTLTVNEGGTLNLGAAGQTVPLTRTNEGSLVLNGGTMGAWNSSAITISVPVTVSSNSIIRASTATGDAATIIFTGAITGSGNLTITGGGKVVFAGDMSGFTGSFAVTSGTLEVPSGVSVTSVAAGAEVVVKTSTSPASLEAAISGGYSLSGSLAIPETVGGTLTFVDSSGNAVLNPSSTWENDVRTFTGTAPVNGIYTGDKWWWDYEFNGNVTSIGSDTGGMDLEGSGASYTAVDSSGNQELYFQKTPYRSATFSNKDALTAVMYCQPGNYANSVLVGFGTTYNPGVAVALVTGDHPDLGEMKLVLIQRSGNTVTVTSLADLTAVGATATKHLYAFVIDRITENETTKTRIRVYLDGKVKAIYKHNGTLNLTNGFQIGSLYGGVKATDSSWDTGLVKYSETGNSGTLDFLRVIDGSLSDGAMAILANTYPYESAHGEATRDPISSAASWVSTDAWTQTVPEQADTTQAAPNTDTNVKLSIDGSSAVSVALNLTTDSNYESLTLGKEAGATGSLNLTSGMGNSTAGKLVSAETSVLVDTTVPAGRVNLGVTSVADGITLTVDPYSPSGNTALAAKFNTMAFGDIYEDVIISMALLGDDAAVALDETYKSSWEDAGFTIELIYDSSNLSYTLRVTREAATADIRVEIAAGGTVTWSTRTIPVPAPESLPDTYANTVTITNMTESAVAISTAFAGGNVTVASGGPVTLSGEITTSGNLTLNGATTLSGTSTISGAVSGSATLTVGSSVTVASTGSIANTIAGDGTLTFEALPASALSFGEWTGTVVLPANQAFGGQKFDDYGIAGSTVRLQGANTGWFHYSAANNTNDRAPVATTIEIPSDASLTVTGWSASFANAFNVLKGSGTFAVNITNAIDISYSDYSAYFLLKDVSNFTGSLSATGAGIAIGASKPAHSTTGGKIILTTSATIATGKTWTATEGIVLADAAATLTNTDGALDPAPTTTVANSYVKLTDSTYSVDAYNTVTFTVANATYTRTDALGNAIKDGDTVTFTVAPDANYGVSSVTATSGEVTNDGGTYSYVVTSDATITVEIVRTHVQLTIPVVEHATATVTVGEETASGSSPYTVPYQSNVTVTWTPAAGYKITSGATQIINSIAADTTAAPPTVEAKGATVSGVTFNYGDDFATATVTATVSGDATTYTLTVDGTDYPGAVNGATVTFENVVTGHAAAYDDVDYTIAATDGTSSVVVSGGSGSAPVADVVNANWINENATTHGLAAAGGSWTNAEAVTYSEGKAEISDNRFAATTASTASRVVLEFQVCFSSASEETVSGDAQAAIKLGEDDSVTTFKILTTGNEWTSVSNAGLQIDPSETYTVVLTIDYGSKTYKVDVGGYALTNSAGVASFALASSSAGVQNIDFAGSGTLTSLKGSQFEGYMVKDALNNFYATIQAATQAYNSANGPYTVLHDGTAPDGWKIDETTKALIKLAKGFFFMAY